MERIKSCIKPAILIIVYITVLSYTVSMVATVQPALQRIGYGVRHADARA